MSDKDKKLAAMRRLSPRRNTTSANSVDELVAEQLAHFGIDPASDYGRTLGRIAGRMYGVSQSTHAEGGFFSSPDCRASVRN